MHEDRELLEAFRRGDRCALAKVYCKYGKAVYALLKNGFAFQSGASRYRFAGCSSEHDAEEMMQEVFRKAFEERARLAYDGLHRYKGYLLTIARNHVIDELRRPRNRLEVLAGIDEERAEEASQQVESAPPPDPEQAAIDEQLRQLVASFRQTLSQPELGIFDLRFGEELDQEQTAQRLGLSVYKVRNLERRLRRRLLTQLTKHGYLNEPRARGKVLTLLGVLL